MRVSALLADKVAELLGRARKEVDEGITPAAQLAIGYQGEVVEFHTLGDTTHGDASRFVMYSCTKAVVAACVWQLLGEGKLHLTDKVADHIPEFGTNGKDVVTVEQVLLHTCGFPSAPLGPPAWETREGRLAAFSRWRLNWEPGTNFEYHATSSPWVQVELLATIDGVDFRESVRRRVIEPLGLQALELGVPLAAQGDVQQPVLTGQPPTPEEFEAVLGIPGLDLGEVTDDALLFLGGPQAMSVGVPGGGGVSSAADMALFYQALLHNSGELWDPVWLAEARVIRNTFPDGFRGVPANRGLGIMVCGPDGQGVRHGFGHTNTPGTFGHDGAGGQLAWADPGTGLSFCYLTNGLDQHVLRQGRRNVALSSRAAACLPA